MMLTDWLVGFYKIYAHQGWMNFVWVYLMLHLYSTLHECGHALIALLLGIRVTRFQTGHPVLGQFTADGILLQFGIFPAGAVSYAYADDAPRWKVAAAALAGPIFPLLISAPLFMTPLSPYFTHFFGLLAIMGALVNLWPWKRGSDGQKFIVHLRMIYRGHKTLDT
ncbi:site-2 protease family protein [Phytobacter diazotrophicus]